MFLLYTYLHIYAQKLNQKSVLTKMSLFEFLIPLCSCSYVLLFLSSTYLSLPKMFQYAFYFHLHDKYMVQLCHFKKKVKKTVQFKHDWLSNYLCKCQQAGFQIFLPPLISHDCTLVFLLSMDSMSLYIHDDLLSHSLLTVNSYF